MRHKVTWWFKCGTDGLIRGTDIVTIDHFLSKSEVRDLMRDVAYANESLKELMPKFWSRASFANNPESWDVLNIIELKENQK